MSSSSKKPVLSGTQAPSGTQHAPVSPDASTKVEHPVQQRVHEIEDQSGKHSGQTSKEKIEPKAEEPKKTKENIQDSAPVQNSAPHPEEGEKHHEEDSKKPDSKSIADHAAILRSRPFIIKTLKHDGSEGGGQVTGSILSQSLDKMMQASSRKDVESMTLAALRKIVPQMSRYASIEKFCTPSGTLLDDESISIVEYLQVEGAEDAASTTGTPSVKLFFRSTKLGESTHKGSDGAAASSVEAPDLSNGPSVKAREVESLQNLTKSQESHELISSADLEVSAGDSHPGAGLLDETQWATVLRNCAVFYGWIIDPRTKRIVRAPKPAFQLRSKVDQEPVAKIPDFVPAEASSDEKDEDSIFDEKLDFPSERTPKTEDPKPSKESAAATSLAKPDKSDKPDKQDKDDKSKKEDTSDNTDKKEKTKGTKKAPAKAVEADAGKGSVAAITPKSDQGIPNFRVNDDSHIEITAHENELTVAMAKSDFSEQSTEASVSGGGYGVSVGVSAGFGSSQSNTAKTMTSNTNRTLVARYMFPRCDLLLWPDEMEPTQELAELIETIRKTKNIKALRRLHAEYGNLFCQRVTIGGRLLSTKVVTTSEKQTMEEHKESFKKSVGASVSGGYAGFSASASVKHEANQGGDKVNEDTAKTQNEAAVFEAVGGETILSTDPKSWCPTVANHELWRVINREGLSPLVEILSGMPGYAAVQSWFVQAVPALNRYIVINEGHECRVRLRVMSPTNSLSIPNAGQNASFYLGHDPAGSITPRLNGIDTSSQDVFWFRIDTQEDIPIFNPATYRAPAIFGYDNFDVGGTKYGADYNTEFVKTEWDLVAPFDEDLKSGTRVIIRSCPFKDAKDTTNPSPSHIVIFRNAQGEFVPAMSDSDEYQYWRIMKTDTSQQHIKPGDEIRLCWDFNDQTTGWRDFSQDVFGRRQVEAPAETPGPLFLKVPWPRFEVTGKPTGLIMSSESGELVAKAVNVDHKGKSEVFKYCLQDLRLRVDTVGNDGRGDADDYLLNKVQQQGVDVHVLIRPGGYPMQMRKDMFWFGIS